MVHTVVCEFFPYAMDPTDLCLSSENAFSSDFTSDSSDFATENFQLIHHGVYSVFEGGNLSIHLGSLDLNSLGQIAICDLCDNASDFSKGLLERFIGLLMFS